MQAEAEPKGAASRSNHVVVPVRGPLPYILSYSNYRLEEEQVS